jgi:luciferase-type oxidoreductase
MDSIQIHSTSRNSVRFNRHRGYKRLFSGDRMTLGVELPLEADWSPEGDRHRRIDGRPFGVPSMSEHARLAQLADQYGFAGLWIRDVPLYQAQFGDAGQIFEPFVYLGYLAAITRSIAISTAAIILPLRQPLLAAKAAASVDYLSNERFIFGIATGDRPIEFPLFGVNFEARGEMLRNAVETLRFVWANPGVPLIDGTLPDVNVLPKPIGQIPMMMAGRGQQSLEWIAQYLDGWIHYPLGDQEAMKAVICEWRKLTSVLRDGEHKPFITTYLVDLIDNPNATPEPFRSGAALGRNHLLAHLDALADAGVNHLALNFRRSRRPVDEVMQEISEQVLPLFPSSVVSEVS